MVFDRRFTAASPRYLGFDALLFGPKQKSDELRPPLLNPLVLLTRSFLMVLDGASVAQNSRLGNVERT